MKKILITGGAGFIGFHLSSKLLLNPENNLVIVDNLQRGKFDKQFAQLVQHERVTFLQADLTDQSFFEKLDTDFSHVYHLAAVNGTKLFYEIPQEVLRINTLSLIYILEWIKQLDKKPKFCFTSSNEAYAGALNSFNQLPIPTPENVPLVVSDVYNARWSYGGSKIIGELFTINYAQAYNFPAVIVRPHNFYGPRAGYEHVIPQFCEKIIQKMDPFVLYSPEETRTFCYIEDAVEALQLLMDSPNTDSQPIEIVHIGNTDEITILDLAKKMFSLTGWSPRNLENQPSPKGSVKRRLADISKIQKLITWSPSTSLDEGLSKTYEWYKGNPKQT